MLGQTFPPKWLLFTWNNVFFLFPFVPSTSFYVSTQAKKQTKSPGFYVSVSTFVDCNADRAERRCYVVFCSSHMFLCASFIFILFAHVCDYLDCELIGVWILCGAGKEARVA